MIYKIIITQQNFYISTQQSYKIQYIFILLFSLIPIKPSNLPFHT